MKLRAIVENENGTHSNLNLKKENRLITYGSEFEINDDRAKELLNIRINNKPIVEKIKETKSKQD